MIEGLTAVSGAFQPVVQKLIMKKSVKTKY